MKQVIGELVNISNFLTYLDKKGGCVYKKEVDETTKTAYFNNMLSSGFIRMDPEDRIYITDVGKKIISLQHHPTILSILWEKARKIL